MSDSTYSIMRSAKRFFGGTMLSRATGLFRDISMAYAFGTQEAVAAFLVAFRFAHLLRRLFGEGALQSAFIPQFEELKLKQSQRAGAFFCDLTAVLTVGLSTLILLCMIILYGLLTLVELSSGNAEIIYLTMLLMPSLLFICLFGVNASLLQCEKSYFLPGVAPVAFNIIWTIGVLTLSNTPASSAMPTLALWVIVACGGQWLMTMPAVWKSLKMTYGGIWSGIQLLSPEIKKFAKPLMLGILGVAATQVNNALDAIFARIADVEGPALLWYALRIQQLPLALFGIAISGALLPPLTRAIKANETAKYQNFLEFAIRRTIALMLPITAALFVLGDTCVALLYGHGDFDKYSILGTTQCLWGYAIGLLPMALVLMFAPAFYAQEDLKTPAKGSVLAMLLNTALNLILIGIFNVGAGSIAIATSVSALGNLVFLGYALRRTCPVVTSAMIESLMKVLLVSMLASVAVVISDLYLFGGSTALQMMWGNIPQFPMIVRDQLWQFAVQSLVFTSVLLGSAKLFNVSDLLGLFFAKKSQSQVA